MKKLRINPGITFLIVLLSLTLLVVGFGISASSQSPSPTTTASPAIASPSPTATATMTASQDIVETAMADGRFTTLVAAIQAAGLVDTLKGQGPFTVFAPTDDAFMKLPPGTLDNLLKDIPALRNILLYHVVQGRYLSNDILKLTSLNTVETAPLMIGIKVNEANVVFPNIVTRNGVIHIIDTVLIPPVAPSPTASPLASPTSSPMSTP